MEEQKTTCQACGAPILVRTAEATGGFCRSGRCEAQRRSGGGSLQQLAIVQSLLERGELRPCPQCGNLIRQSRLRHHTDEKCEMRARPHPYSKVLPQAPVPEWLERVAASSALPTPIPLADLLRDSCFYPSSGLDSSPVLIANGCMHSFVYIDYGTNREDFMRALSFPGFSPYEVLLHRDLQIHEILPDGWLPSFHRRFDNPGFDGRRRLMEAQQRCVPFGHWSVWRRKEKRGEFVGPRLFSFLFLGGEALAGYEGLYRRNHITPKAIALIQPGHAFGDNWTNFYDPDAPFWQSVCAGGSFPDYLLIGGYGKRASEQCPFEGYEHVHTTSTYVGQGHRHLAHRTIDIFRRSRVA